MLRRLDRVAKEIVRSALLRQVHRSIEIVLPAPRDISRNHDLTLVPTSHIQTENAQRNAAISPARVPNNLRVSPKRPIFEGLFRSH